MRSTKNCDAHRLTPYKHRHPLHSFSAIYFFAVASSFLLQLPLCTLQTFSLQRPPAPSLPYLRPPHLHDFSQPAPAMWAIYNVMPTISLSVSWGGTVSGTTCNERIQIFLHYAAHYYLVYSIPHATNHHIVLSTTCY